MNEEAATIWNKIAEIKDQMELHNITREEAQAQVEPLLGQLNERLVALNNKYGKRTPKGMLLTYIKAMNSPLLTRSVGETKARYGSNN